VNTPRPTSPTPTAVGLVGLPELADPFRAAGLAVVGGKDFRGSATAIRDHIRDRGPLVVLAADTKVPGLVSWLDTTAANAPVVLLRTEPAGGMNPAGSKQVALPATIDEILSVGGMSALGGVVGNATVHPDGSVLPSPARTSSTPPASPSVPSSPVEQEADPFADARPQAPAGPRRPPKPHLHQAGTLIRRRPVRHHHRVGTPSLRRCRTARHQRSHQPRPTPPRVGTPSPWTRPVQHLHRAGTPSRWRPRARKARTGHRKSGRNAHPPTTTAGTPHRCAGTLLTPRPRHRRRGIREPTNTPAHRHPCPARRNHKVGMSTPRTDPDPRCSPPGSRSPPRTPPHLKLCRPPKVAGPSTGSARRRPPSAPHRPIRGRLLPPRCR